MFFCWPYTKNVQAMVCKSVCSGEQYRTIMVLLSFNFNCLLSFVVEGYGIWRGSVVLPVKSEFDLTLATITYMYTQFY